MTNGCEDFENFKAFVDGIYGGGFISVGRRNLYGLFLVISVKVQPRREVDSTLLQFTLVVPQCEQSHCWFQRLTLTLTLIPR